MAKYFKEITNLRTIIASAIVFGIGVILLLLSERITFEPGYSWIKSSISNFGGLLVATISIATLWELFSKRSFLDELLEKTAFAEDIRSTGLMGISMNPVRGPDFTKIIRNAERLDIFVCYANTWRATYEEDLRYLASKKKTRIRLIVPDPDNTEIMKELAHRFKVSDEKHMADRVLHAIEEYKALFLSPKNTTLDFSIWVHNETPITSFYRFDKCAILTLYKHAKGRGNVPSLIAERGGSLYGYIEAEVDSLIKGIQEQPPLAKKIYPYEDGSKKN